MNLRPVVDCLAYTALRVLICIIQAMRIETCHSLSRMAAFLLSDCFRLRGAVVDDNLKNVFPDLTAAERRQISRQMWEHLFLMVCEIAHAPRKIHRSNWRDHISFRGRREIVQYLLDPRPSVLVTGHFGNFELGGFITGLLGFPSFTVARTLDNPYLDRYVNSFRGANGQFILPKKGSSPQVQAVLESGGVLSLLGDQFAGQKGCWVDFLGRPASCHKAIALFPLTSGAPMLAAATTRLGAPMKFKISLLGVLDPAESRSLVRSVPAVTQWYNDRLGDAIRLTPHQYWWLHRRWKGTPPKRMLARRSVAA
ncbi:MAG: lysophospholipid acyltransferase family protein [Planctomycetales bacterium]|nr:lysophospholipid acyltransferase family protein [Planctomycetales bacterium]